MRKLEPRLVITFPTTTAAMAFEAACKKNDLPGRIIPVPRQITAGCGLSWCADITDREKLLSFIESNDMTMEAVSEVELYV